MTGRLETVRKVLDTDQLVDFQQRQCDGCTSTRR